MSESTEREGALTPIGKWRELFRAWRWVPTNKLRERTVWSFHAQGLQLTLVERERLHFGRWGLWRWRYEEAWWDVRTAEDAA